MVFDPYLIRRRNPRPVVVVREKWLCLFAWKKSDLNLRNALNAQSLRVQNNTTTKNNI